MHLLFETSKEVGPSLKALKDNGALFSKKLKVPFEVEILKQGDSLSLKDFVYFLEQGVLSLSKEGQSILLFEEGDWMGASFFNDHPELQFQVKDLDVQLRKYPRQKFLEMLQENPSLLREWMYMEGEVSSLLLSMFLALLPSSGGVEPQMRDFDEGETIVEEGSVGNEVFTLLSGEAVVFKEKVEVGRIEQDEIFGAMAALTESPRSASVVAKSSCQVLSLPATHFKELLRSRPDTVVRLVHSMARTILSLNEKLIAQKKDF